jgi:hypothetical protein
MGEDAGHAWHSVSGIKQRSRGKLHEEREPGQSSTSVHISRSHSFTPLSTLSYPIPSQPDPTPPSQNKQNPPTDAAAAANAAAAAGGRRVDLLGCRVSESGLGIEAEGAGLLKDLWALTSGECNPSPLSDCHALPWLNALPSLGRKHGPWVNAWSQPPAAPD